MRKVLALALLAALPLTACGEKAPEAERASMAVPSGPRITLRYSDVPDWQAVSAEITAQDQAQVLARSAGVLSSFTVRAGDRVTRGQLIGQISDDLGGGASVAAAARAQADVARQELERVRFLYQNGVYAKAKLDQAESMARMAQAQVHGASAAQRLVAPASGLVLRAEIPAGAAVAPGMVVAVVTSGPVLLRLDLPETLAVRVQHGALVELEGLAGHGVVQGRVTRIYPAVTAGRVSADVAMEGLDQRLIGHRVAARIATGMRRAILLPRGFVTTRYGLDYVNVVAKDGSISTVAVQTAKAQGDHVEILSGLNAGDTLVSGAGGAGVQGKGQ
ncbi:efflux RND transporter periplasmic adaptor subunit [Novosphingobium umbonatum]|uniref:Efflux RND transporter periplasmic adaptor subunit n=1 Tax=Novosphingobium umbonatum TaxID=1908524 RepID=A0A437N6Z6_9SPHN|nr:efflux RND transporter periplasmic adaptor subunit [Novosphingobium umbonatum]RVU05694.1 efflux RND transporter periplasmic adaptor subunit [Novosphingobium umbonatum]